MNGIIFGENKWGTFGESCDHCVVTILASVLAETTGKTYQCDKDYPRCKYECREDSRHERRRSLLFWAEGVFYSGLGMVMDFLWVRDNGL